MTQAFLFDGSDLVTAPRARQTDRFAASCSMLTMGTPCIAKKVLS